MGTESKKTELSLNVEENFMCLLFNYYQYTLDKFTAEVRSPSWFVLRRTPPPTGRETETCICDGPQHEIG